MSEAFLSEIRIMSYGFAPRGWAQCNGQLLPINQNQALFSLLGTTYGGDGRVNFALPDLRGRVAIHRGAAYRGGPSYTLGEKAGEAAHTVTMNEMPTHVHSVAASSAANNGVAAPANNYLGGANNTYHAVKNASLTTINSGTVTNTGGSQPHNNMQPYLTLNFCICLMGVFPSQN